MDPLDADLLPLETKARAATPGPWSYEPDEGGTDSHGFALQATIRFGARYAKYGYDEADAAYVAAVSPDVVLDLLERLRHKQVVINALATAPSRDTS